MDGQIAAYRERSWNVLSKLWCGTIWMIENSDRLHRCWDDWWDDNLRFGMMDQLSLPVWLDHHKLQPQALNVWLWENDYFSWVPHLHMRGGGGLRDRLPARSRLRALLRSADARPRRPGS